MKVVVLQQYLRNLIAPLTASGAAANVPADLERACQGLEPFRDRDVSELAEFLNRSHAYERDGQWPSRQPPIHGLIVDEPTIPQYAERLRHFLSRTVTTDAPVSDVVRGELTKLADRLKGLPQLRELARELGVDEPFTKKPQGMEKIVFKLTGQRLSGKGKAAKVPADVQRHAADLLKLSDPAQLKAELDKLESSLKIDEVRALAHALGVTGGIRSKPQGMEKILQHLTTPQTAATPADATTAATDPAREAKITRSVDILNALKAKAEGPDAPEDEIEAELRSLENQLDKEEAITVAQKFGIVRHVDSRTEALEAIRRKVFEVKRAKESIAY